MIKYIATDKGRHDPNDKRFMIFHNLPSTDLDAVNRAFQANAKYLNTRGKNVFYHEYFSFSQEDAPFLTREFLDEMSREYLSIRAPNALAYGNIHWNGDNPHVHLMISANNFQEASRQTKSRSEFRQIHRQLEKWQRSRKPELRSVVILDKEPRSKTRLEREKTNRRENEKKLRHRLKQQKTDKIPLKDQISTTVRQCLKKASGIESFAALLEAHNMKLYYRRGKLSGVVYKNRKWRFLRSLGISKDELLNLEYQHRSRSRGRSRNR